MLFTPSAYEDIVRYYKNTYVKFKETGETLYYINTVQEMLVEAVDLKGDKVRIYLSEEAPYEVDYVLPHKSYFQEGENACMLWRIPAQQYKRGICCENVAMSITHSMSDGGGRCDLDVSFERLQRYVNKPTFATLAHAVADPDGYCSYALSPRMAYMVEDKTILVDFTPVAVLVDGKFKMTRPVFTKEVVEIAKGFEVV